jgi:hypothetical protein
MHTPMTAEEYESEKVKGVPEAPLLRFSCCLLHCFVCMGVIPPVDMFWFAT